MYGGGLIDNTYSYIDDVTWQHGLHSIRMGVQALRYQNNYPTANNNGYLGSLTYSGDFSSNPSAANAGGYGGADFLLDRVTQAARLWPVSTSANASGVSPDMRRMIIEFVLT